MRVRHAMIAPNEISDRERPVKSNGRAATPFRAIVVSGTVLVLCFIRPLYDLARHAAENDFYSYIFLVPFISAYLAWLKRSNRRGTHSPNRILAFVLAGSGLLVLSLYWTLVLGGTKLPRADSLALTIP